MNSSQPLVSVLLSIYKVEEYLEECLDSILAQSYTNLEIVCVNNGSPDKCGEILKKYAKKDKRIKVITLKENKMVCGGRNVGLDNATGEFICFVDPDDWIEKNYVKSMVDAILTKKDPNGHFYNLIMNTSVKRFTRRNNNIKLIDHRRTSGGYRTIDDYNKDTLWEIAIPMWGRLYNSKFVKQNNIRFLEGFHTDNIPFTIKLLALMKCWYVITAEDNDNSAYCYRLVTMDGSITPIIALKGLELPKCLDNLYSYLKEFNLAQKIKVPYYSFFSTYFPRHEDMPRYYAAFKKLMIKMENDIKSSPETVYQRSDKDLCNFLIYTSDFFQFVDWYFKAPTINEPTTYTFQNYILKLFGLPLLKKKNKGNKVKYYFLGIPIWKTKIKNNTQKGYLFGVIPLLKFIKK